MPNRPPVDSGGPVPFQALPYCNMVEQLHLGGLSGRGKSTMQELKTSQHSHITCTPSSVYCSQRVSPREDQELGVLGNSAQAARPLSRLGESRQLADMTMCPFPNLSPFIPILGLVTHVIVQPDSQGLISHVLGSPLTGPFAVLTIRLFKKLCCSLTVCRELLIFLTLFQVSSLFSKIKRSTAKGLRLP